MICSRVLVNSRAQQTHGAKFVHCGALNEGAPRSSAHMARAGTAKAQTPLASLNPLSPPRAGRRAGAE